MSELKASTKQEKKALKIFKKTLKNYRDPSDYIILILAGEIDQEYIELTYQSEELNRYITAIKTYMAEPMLMRQCELAYDCQYNNNCEPWEEYLEEFRSDDEECIDEECIEVEEYKKNFLPFEMPNFITALFKHTPKADGFLNLPFVKQDDLNNLFGIDVSDKLKALFTGGAGDFYALWLYKDALTTDTAPVVYISHEGCGVEVVANNLLHFVGLSIKSSYGDVSSGVLEEEKEKENETFLTKFIAFFDEESDPYDVHRSRREVKQILKKRPYSSLKVSIPKQILPEIKKAQQNHPSPFTDLNRYTFLAGFKKQKIPAVINEAALKLYLEDNKDYDYKLTDKFVLSSDDYIEALCRKSKSTAETKCLFFNIVSYRFNPGQIDPFEASYGLWIYDNQGLSDAPVVYFPKIPYDFQFSITKPDQCAEILTTQPLLKPCVIANNINEFFSLLATGYPAFHPDFLKKQEWIAFATNEDDKNSIVKYQKNNTKELDNFRQIIKEHFNINPTDDIAAVIENAQKNHPNPVQELFSGNFKYDIYSYDDELLFKNYD